MSITQSSDVEIGFKGDTSDSGYVMGLIERAERKLEVRLGDLETWANTPKRLAAVKDVVSEMVQKVLRSGDSIFKTESDASYSYTVDPMVASANLWVTDDMWAQLLGPDATDSGFGSIRVGIPDWSGRKTW